MKIFTLKRSIQLSYFVLIVSLVNLFFYNLPFYKYVINNLDYRTLNGTLILISLTILVIFLNALVFYIVLYASRFIGKFLLVMFANISAISVYFINTYGVIIDRTMIGNVFNTNYEESSSYLSLGLIMYFVLLGIIPSILIIKTKTKKAKFKRFITQVGLTTLFIAVLIFVNFGNSLWIDKNSKVLGGLTMPWSYVVNTGRFYSHKHKVNKKEILLPDATIKDHKKSIVVLVIGESARSMNFSLYGYEKDTNPLLSETDNVHPLKATACATYTTAAVKCILSYSQSSKLYEILPNYLFRNGVDVYWRSTNWGEPPVHIQNYLSKPELEELCQGDRCQYDEVLLNGLTEQILASEKDKILVILHSSTSHGPTYFKKYPEEFNKFTPTCKSVELNNCTHEELVNAYDNTIVYTDYILSTLIEELKQLEGYNSTMLFVSDHGESLGENNLYMHGVPNSLAPDEQLDIPFIVWTSYNSRELKENEEVSQHYVFHSVLDFLSVESPIFDENLSIFVKEDN